MATKSKTPDSAPPKKEEQFLLLRPESPLKPDKSGMMPLPAIAHQECHCEDSLRENVVSFGVLSPVVLTGDNPYTIIDGRRRVKIAKIAGIEEIPFVWYEKLEDALAATAGLSFGYLRSDNLYAEIDQLARLTLRHANEKQIAQAIGVPIKQITKRLKLLKLHVPLRNGLLDNSVPAAVAIKVCGWTEVEQEQLCEILKRKGKLTWVDLHLVRSGKGRAKGADATVEPGELEKAGGKLVFHLHECRSNLGEVPAAAVNNLFRSMAMVAETMTEWLDLAHTEKLNEAIKEFEEAARK